MDHEELLCIPEVQLMQGGHVSALMFLKILNALMFGTDADIGLDPHYEVNRDTSKVTAVTVDNKHFEVKRMIYSLDSLVGQGT